MIFGGGGTPMIFGGGGTPMGGGGTPMIFGGGGSIGRFIQKDPKGMVDRSNLYVYVVNNPVVFCDPEGSTIFAPMAAKESCWSTDAKGDWHYWAGEKCCIKSKRKCKVKGWGPFRWTECKNTCTKHGKWGRKNWYTCICK